MADKSHHINESADKVVLKTEIKRGTDTRDQDKINVKVKGNSPELTANKLHDTVEQIKALGTVDTVRGTRASED